MLIISNIGDHVWLMTSRQTEPDLYESHASVRAAGSKVAQPKVFTPPERHVPYSSSIFGWKMRFTKPMLGLL